MVAYPGSMAAVRESNGDTGSWCLDKAVLAQEGGGRTSGPQKCAPKLPWAHPVLGCSLVRSGFGTTLLTTDPATQIR